MSPDCMQLYSEGKKRCNLHHDDFDRLSRWSGDCIETSCPKLGEFHQEEKGTTIEIP
ncbi:unnamed protein product, partial [Rotaria magnacalcarata]